MSRSLVRRRIVGAFLGLALCFGLIAARLFWIQLVDGRSLAEAAEAMRTRVVDVPARRGTIWDRRGRELAISVNVSSVYADPAEVRDPDRTARQLALALGLNPAAVRRSLSEKTLFVWIARQIDDRKAAAVRALGLPGIYLAPEAKRVYPQGSLASQIIGFVGIDSQGLSGVELEYDRELRGQPGQIVVEYDARGRELPQAVHRFLPPVDGQGLRLTIDETIQYMAERDLDRAVAEHRALAGHILVMDPRTGEVLAAANWPTFDPNHWQEAPAQLWNNPLVSSTFPPGSIFKPVTAAAALEAHVVTPDATFMDTGVFTVGGAEIRNWNNKAYGLATFRTAFAQSLNTIFARVGSAVGVDTFYRYVDAFGLRQPTGVDLPGEVGGIFPPPGRVRPVDLAVMSFGQTLAVTPLQLATAIGAIANGGELMWPHVALAHQTPDGREVPVAPRAVRRVLAPQTARLLAQLMEDVVQQGTGQDAQIPGFAVAGKTGTSQKVIGGRVATSGHYISSFVGFAPADDPRAVVLVVIDEPQGLPYGGYVAAPVFRDVMQETLHVLGVPPELPSATVAVPSLVGLTTAAAARLLAAQHLVLAGSGQGTVVAQDPVPGTLVPAGTAIRVRYALP